MPNLWLAARGSLYLYYYLHYQTQTCVSCSFEVGTSITGEPLASKALLFLGELEGHLLLLFTHLYYRM
jgi:hypothetical protein